LVSGKRRHQWRQFIFPTKARNEVFVPGNAAIKIEKVTAPAPTAGAEKINAMEAEIPVIRTAAECRVRE
jgi:hypothetical protein